MSPEPTAKRLARQKGLVQITKPFWVLVTLLDVL